MREIGRSNPWWKDAVIYQIYPRSWVDSNGDGIGDIRGITSRLDHLAWLGVDAIWLNPVTSSPNRDWGYDVSDYCAVHPELGSMDDLDELIKVARARDITIILDLVPNHTSDEHPWFEEARSARSARRRDWYVWADPSTDESPPNNWLRSLGRGPAWTLDHASGQYYMHSFLPGQPDLNWWNEEVKEAFDDILRFWFDRGVGGFRIDVAHALIHDPTLRANPPVTPEDHPQTTRLGQRQIHNMNRPEVHDIIKRWRSLSDGYRDGRVLIGETYLFDLAEVARYYGERGDELHLAFNFPFIFSSFEAPALASIVAATRDVLPPDASAAWTGSNHDVGRFMTRWCAGDDRLSRCAMMMLLTLPGVPFIYYGDEIAMPEVPIPKGRLRDPAGIEGWPDPGRDRARTPMQWHPRPGAGFTDAGMEPWLPIGDYRACNVEDQRADPASHLTLTRSLIATRAESRDLRTGGYRVAKVEDGLWGYRRGRRTSVWLNLSDNGCRVEGEQGVIVVCTDEGRRGTEVISALDLQPWQGVILRLPGPPPSGAPDE